MDGAAAAVGLKCVQARRVDRRSQQQQQHLPHRACELCRMHTFLQEMERAVAKREVISTKVSEGFLWWHSCKLSGRVCRPAWCLHSGPEQGQTQHPAVRSVQVAPETGWFG